MTPLLFFAMIGALMPTPKTYAAGDMLPLLKRHEIQVMLGVAGVAELDRLAKAQLSKSGPGPVPGP